MRRTFQFLFTCALAASAMMLAACGREAPVPATAPASVTAKVVTAAPKPTGPLAADASCITAVCHASYRSAPHLHQPTAVGACFSCHLQDTGNHTYPVARKGNAMCTFCHAVSGTKQHQHKAIEQQGCTACHDPHASRAKFLLVGDTVGATCARCHETPMKKHAHEPFAAGQCTVCHQPHQSEYPSLLRNGAGADHCFGCHTDKQKAMTQLPHVHKASLEACTNCHGPHATDYPKQLKRSANDTCLSCHAKLKDEMAKANVVHGAIAEGCVTCHDPHASSQPGELKERMDKVCLTCHDKPMKTASGRNIASMAPVLASSSLHGPVRSGGCSECHNPHAANEPNLLRKYFPDRFYAGFDVNNYALCFTCHDKQLVLLPKTAALTNFRDGDRNLHFVHVNRSEKGRTCKSCHDVHGSNLPNHMAASVPFEGSGWAMPIKYEAARDGGTCTPGCHDEKSYHRNKPVSTAPKSNPETPLINPPAATEPATRGAQ